MPALDRAYINAMALGEKLSDFRPAIQSSENCEICRLFVQSGSPTDGEIEKQNGRKIFTVRFTVKTIRLGAIDVDRRRKVIFEISVSYARDPTDGDRSRKAQFTPTQ
jgi:hypothetical protein